MPQFIIASSDEMALKLAVTTAQVAGYTSLPPFLNADEFLRWLGPYKFQTPAFILLDIDDVPKNHPAMRYIKETLAKKRSGENLLKCVILSKNSAWKLSLQELSVDGFLDKNKGGKAFVQELYGLLERELP